MKKILVAGAGHGGLVAAARLAANGYDVTVVEKKNRAELGHDWEDRFTFSLLSEIIGINENEFSSECWKYRGDCAFVSPAKKKKIIINYNENNKQKIMWRAPLINMLINYAEKCGVKFMFSTQILSPIVKHRYVCGFRTDAGEIMSDMVIDAAGVFSPIRTNLPDESGIEKMPKRGDLFYAYRAYYKKSDSSPLPEIPFEVYMYHEGEKGLSWFCTYEDCVDILIGRIDPLTETKINEHIRKFKNSHPWFTDEIIHGGSYGTIPVRRPLTVMVYNGYAAVGDSAFMTTPMNGMGIDLSLNAGKLLSDTIINSNGDFSKESLWEYNKKFHIIFGGETAKNEGLKNSILSVPSEGIDFLFENDVIQSADLAGAGKNTNIQSLMGKFVRGMKKPEYFFAIINGLIKGSRVAAAYKKPPEYFKYDIIKKWNQKIESYDIIIP